MKKIFLVLLLCLGFSALAMPEPTDTVIKNTLFESESFRIEFMKLYKSVKSDFEEAFDEFSIKRGRAGCPGDKAFSRSGSGLVVSFKKEGKLVKNILLTSNGDSHRDLRVCK